MYLCKVSSKKDTELLVMLDPIIKKKLIGEKVLLESNVVHYVSLETKKAF